MENAKPRVKVPATASKGEVIEIKTLISHPMESGQRKDKKGNVIPRKIINKFTASFNGKDFLVADWAPAISANPYMAFYMRATESGTVEFKWVDDDGSVYTTKKKIKVS